MKTLDTTCPNCGAPLKVNLETHDATCEYCGSHIVFDNDEQAGYEFEKGRQRAQQEYEQESENHTYANPQPTAPRRRRTWLWVLGWISIFPLPLTILISRNTQLQPWLKTLIIIAAWFVYFLIGYTNGS